MAQASNTASIQGRLALFFGLSLHILVTTFLARLTMDVGTRLVYPFIPQLSAGLGLSIVGFSWLLFIRSLAGMVGPLFGMAADRYGRRRIMAAGLLCQGLGVTGLAFSQQWWAVGPMILYGIALAGFIPAEQAYVSDQVAYEKRGRALATIEFSWAIAGIVGLPIVGWMIDIFGWRFPLLAVGAASLLGAVAVWFLLPAVEIRSHASLNWRQAKQIFVKPNVLATMGVAFLLFAGVGSFSTIWSIWLSADFGLAATMLGGVATVIGVAELGGSVTSSLFIDRLGKRRGSIIGFLLTAAAFMLLPFTRSSLVLAVPVLLLIGLFIEFTVVSLIPLYSEQVPEARATVFSLVGVGVSISVSLSSPVTAILWERFGLWAVCAVSIVCLLLGAWVTHTLLKGE